MPHTNTADQGRDVIDEYFNVVNWCLSDRGAPAQTPLGYTPTLLLFSIVDAISHSGQTTQGHRVQLDALNDGTSLNLGPEKLASLAKCFRHKLAHAAITAPGRFITDEATGNPFEFSGDDVTLIRVIPFRDLVRELWSRKKGAFDTSAQLGALAASPAALRPTPSGAGAASGVASYPGTPMPTLGGAGTP